MKRIIAIQSFRGGTGKSHVIANLAYLLHLEHKKVAVLDANLAAPNLHLLFDVNPERLEYTLNDYLAHNCEAKDILLDINGQGKLFLIPSTLSAAATTQIAREGCNLERLCEAIRQIAIEFDYLLIDTQSGLGAETLLSLSMANILLILQEPHHLDDPGTAIAREMAKKFAVESCYSVINKAMPAMDIAALHTQSIDAVLPFSDKISAPSNQGLFGIFAQLFPKDPLTEALRHLAKKIARPR
ncbi:MAG: MinD/ParA family protein [Verrucomicrobia bacterium]|nr:MinD/ParA family protein [Verrucomicrobiota bacterium]MDE3046984.1 MinD/ParA family protein [Verrucomicrobiota bacterium]